MYFNLYHCDILYNSVCLPVYTVIEIDSLAYQCKEKEYIKEAIQNFTSTKKKKKPKTYISAKKKTRKGDQKLEITPLKIKLNNRVT